MSVLCASILLYNGCALYPMTKLFNYSKLTSSLFLSPSLCSSACFLSLLSTSTCFSLVLPLSTPNSCHAVYSNLTVVLIGMRLESECQVLSGPKAELYRIFLCNPASVLHENNIVVVVMWYAPDG